MKTGENSCQGILCFACKMLANWKLPPITPVRLDCFCNKETGFGRTLPSHLTIVEVFSEEIAAAVVKGQLLHAANRWRKSDIVSLILNAPITTLHHAELPIPYPHNQTKVPFSVRNGFFFVVVVVACFVHATQPKSLSTVSAGR